MAQRPAGRATVRGKIVAINTREGKEGHSFKGLFVSEEGWKAWGPVPKAWLRRFWNLGSTHKEEASSIDCDPAFGTAIEMTATFDPIRGSGTLLFERPTGVSIDKPKA